MSQSISGAQIRAARALIDWSRPDLSGRCNVHVRTIARFEQGEKVPSPETLSRMRQALELAGIEFVAENGGGEGVRLKEP